MAKTEAHKWEFRPRFRRHAFGRKSQPAIKRVKEAVSGIQKVARSSDTPGEEGKWFTAAKDAKLLDEAIALANHTPCSPQTLTRAARDFRKRNPVFALEAGTAALRWLAEGYGYEITGLDVVDAYAHTMEAAENAGRADETRRRILELVARNTSGESFVAKVLGRQLGLT
ncbi:MAG: hypothetical protein ABIL09_19270 [Gemmatimonadota bacterium]